MIYVGIDDTDIVDSPGTNQLARHLVKLVSDDFCCSLIARHQLLDDPRVPYTSQNGSASLLFRALGSGSTESLADTMRRAIIDWCPVGSDPGLCIATSVPDDVVAWGRRCQQQLVTQAEARQLAAEHDIFLEGLGGTQGGVIGALAAIGLVATGNDGRILHWGEANDDYFDIGGLQSVERLRELGISEVRCLDGAAVIERGMVDVGKRLRPNYRDGKAVVLVEAGNPAADEEPCWRAVRLR